MLYVVDCPRAQIIPWVWDHYHKNHFIFLLFPSSVIFSVSFKTCKSVLNSCDDVKKVLQWQWMIQLPLWNDPLKLWRNKKKTAWVEIQQTDIFRPLKAHLYRHWKETCVLAEWLFSYSMYEVQCTYQVL